MITSIIAFIVSFGILVLVHEFGHFWIARKVGIFVEKFSIGFGPKIFGFKKKGTDFCISLLPLGGFVKMKGEGDEKESQTTDPDAFSNKSVGARSAVVLAGPMMNLLLSFALMPFVFWLGKPEISFLSEPAVIERLLPQSPAEGSGLKIGDKIMRINGKQAPNWETVLETITLSPPGKPVQLHIARNGEEQEIAVNTVPLPNGEGTYAGFEKFFGNAPEAIVTDILPNSPAEKGGLEKGDKIIAVQGAPVTDWDSLIRQVSLHQGKPMNITALREGRPIDLSIQALWDASSERWLMGIRGPEGSGVGILQTKKYGFADAVKMGFKTNVKNILLTFEVLKKLVTLELSYKSLGGPVQIAVTLGKASASGFADFLYFTAFLSLQLAILNILPIPMLDGGHLLFFAFEAVRGRALSLKTRIIAQQVGLVLLLTLILFVTMNDLERLLGWSKWFK
ncbi:MAG: RIP metalloprotease RseP [Deltaproteobacteria bacterium]|nr:RIP metalloprotease RseP [Deltaproteobacteria bacterium]